MLAVAAVLATLLASLGATTAARAASRTDVDAVLDQARSAKTGDDFLPPEQAFRLSANADSSERVRLTWVIAPGYYLYRDRIKVASEAGGVTIGTPQFPPGQVKDDEYFGKQVVYHNELIATVPIARAGPAGQRQLSLAVTYQGCAEAGLCYPPTTRQISITLPGAGGPNAGAGAGGAGAGGAGAGVGAGVSAAAGAGASSGGPTGVVVAEQDRLAALIRSGNMFFVLGYFFVMGVGLAFTPCCWPLVPILSGLIVGHGQRVTAARGFVLALTYVLGMAITYTVAGAAFAAAGKQVQAAFQQPWIIVLFAAFFVAMALSMFGLYTVQMPASIQSRLADTSNRQRAGTVGGVAVMGMLSALIVTTCVAPVLVATLIVIGQSGDVLRGAAALFAMSLGMGAPLLIVGSSAGRWLPRAGVWMDGVKRLFGVVMLALAAWMLTRIVPARWSLLLFAIPAICAAIVCWGLVPADHARRGKPQAGADAPRRGAGRALWLTRSAAVLVGLYGIALLWGAQRGSDDPLLPLAYRPAAGHELAFHGISSLADLQREVQAAAALHQPVMLDFYADWCTSCKEMQRYTFTDPQVRAAMQSLRLLRADVTANSSEDQALLRAFRIYGPPTIAFYDEHGQERHELRVVGYMKADQFETLLQRALAAG